MDAHGESVPYEGGEATTALTALLERSGEENGIEEIEEITLAMTTERKGTQFIKELYNLHDTAVYRQYRMLNPVTLGLTVCSTFRFDFHSKLIYKNA